MAATYRAKTRLCPVLDTAYVPFPREAPGGSLCCQSRTLHHYPTTKTRERQGFRRNVTFTIEGPVDTYVFTKIYMYQDDIIDPWSSFQSNVFNLYGNAPVRLGTLNGIRNTSTNIYYPYGSPLPPTGGIFTPVVTF